jgi:hypothetical protein
MSRSATGWIGIPASRMEKLAEKSVLARNPRINGSFDFIASS